MGNRIIAFRIIIERFVVSALALHKRNKLLTTNLTYISELYYANPSKLNYSTISSFTESA